MAERRYILEEGLDLENGGRLESPVISFQTWGEPLPNGANIVWVCHALTANADVMQWWPGLFGEEGLFNPKAHFIVSANILGSCYGTTGPASEDPATGEPYFETFPLVTIRDQVRAHEALANHLGIGHIGWLIGGSMGGQQALEWAVSAPGRFGKLVVLATNAIHSPWGVAFNEAQRMAIEADASWGQKTLEAGMLGMKAARATALLSYRGYEAFGKTQKPRPGDDPWDGQPAASYQRYQGAKLAKRFNAWSYWYLSKAMDSHDLGRNRGGAEAALGAIRAQTLVLGLENDLLFPEAEQRRIAEGVPNGHFESIASDFGHDGFLIETFAIAREIEKYFGVNSYSLSENGFETGRAKKIDLTKNHIELK